MKEKELTALLTTQDRFFFSIISYKKRLSSSLSQYLLINLVVLCPIFEIRRSCLTYSYTKSYAGYVNKYRKRERAGWIYLGQHLTFSSDRLDSEGFLSTTIFGFSEELLGLETADIIDEEEKWVYQMLPSFTV